MHQSRTRKPLKNQQVEKRGTCTPTQGSGATLGVSGYPMNDILHSYLR